MTTPVQQPSVFGALAQLATTTASAATNVVKSVDNLACAAERVSYMAKSKATNIAELSDTADSMKMLVARKELQDQMNTLGASYVDGVLTFN